MLSKGTGFEGCSTTELRSEERLDSNQRPPGPIIETIRLNREVVSQRREELNIVKYVTRAQVTTVILSAAKNLSVVAQRLSIDGPLRRGMLRLHSASLRSAQHDGAF